MTYDALIMNKLNDVDIKINTSKKQKFDPDDVISNIIYLQN